MICDKVHKFCQIEMSRLFVSLKSRQPKLCQSKTPANKTSKNSSNRSILLEFEGKIFTRESYALLYGIQHGGMR